MDGVPSIGSIVGPRPTITTTKEVLVLQMILAMERDLFLVLSHFTAATTLLAHSKGTNDDDAEPDNKNDIDNNI